MRINTWILVMISIFFLGCNTTGKPVNNKANTELAQKEQEEKKKQEEEKKRQEEEKRQRELRERQAREAEEAAKPVPANRTGQSLTRVRVNQEIVNWIQQLDESGEDIQRLIFYLDKSFSLEIEETDTSPLVDIAKDGMLLINAPAPLPPINFSDIQQGKIITFTPEINETFVITAEAANKHIAMRFRKNAQQNYYYELFSMEIDSVNYNLVPLKPAEEFPMLYIYALIDEKIRDEREYTADFLAVQNEHLRDFEIRKEQIRTAPVRKEEIAQPQRTEETAEAGRTAEPAHLTDANREMTHNENEIARHEDEITSLEDAISRLEKEISLHQEEISHHEDKGKDEPNKIAEVNTVNELIIDPKTGNITASSAAQTTPAPETAVVKNDVKQNQPAVQNQRTVNLMGKGTLPGESVYNFVKTKTRNPVISDNEIKRLINLYIEEANFEEVNYDIAIAQMLYMTSILGNPEYVINNNFAGLTPVRGKWETGKFDTMQDGVRAHIQQLRGYARDNLNRPEIITPRWNMISDFRGSITTLEELSSRWSSNPVRYRENIEKILSDLYTFSEK